MASLKEIKTRIGSVQGTRKVTSAMKMVSSAKLHKAQSIITAMVPYQQNLDKIVSNFLAGKTVFSSPYVLKEEEDAKKSVSKVAVVAFSSNSSLSLLWVMKMNSVKNQTIQFEVLKAGII